MQREVFRTDNVVYRRGGVKLLDNFNMHIFESEVFGLFFTDNRGKNEIVSLAMEGGTLDYGSVSLGEECINSFILPALPRAGGVSLISRDELLLDEMTVAENIFVVRRNFRKFVIDAGVIKSQYELFAAEYDIDIAGGALVRNLPPVDRYIIRLLKAVIEGSLLIIVKDIGLSADGPEMERFHRYVRRFAESGVSFLYISGDAGELFRICDRVGVAGYGRIVRTIRREDFDEEHLRNYYFGPEQARPPAETGRTTVLSFNAVPAAGAEQVEFEVTEGESVLFWDRSDTLIDHLAGILSGEKKPVSGHVLIDGAAPESFKGRAPISVIHEAPLRNSIFEDMSYLDNICFKAANRFPALWRKAALKQAIRNEYYPIVGDDIDALPPLSLSQEAIYTLVYLREHIYRPRLLVLVRPFLDTDIRLKMHILSLIERLRALGASLLILDSSVSESTTIADRVLTLKGASAKQRTEKQPWQN